MIALPPDIAVNIPKLSESGLEALADVLLDSMESSCPRDMGAMPDHVVVEDDGQPYTLGMPRGLTTPLPKRGAIQGK